MCVRVCVCVRERACVSVCLSLLVNVTLLFLCVVFQNRGSPFRIRRVNKTETDDAYQVTFEYEASAEPAVYLQLKCM